MTEKSCQRTVTFAHPFSLNGVDGTFPAGTYEIEETLEQVGGLSFIGYRRTKTTIELPAANAAYFSRQLVVIEPDDLVAALARDAGGGNGRLVGLGWVRSSISTPHNAACRPLSARIRYYA